MLYNCYRVVGKREILRLEKVNLEEAIHFLRTERSCFVKDQLLNIYKNEKDLEYVKNIRSKVKSGVDYEFTDRGQILENSDTELSGVDTDNSEPSPECDN